MTPDVSSVLAAGGELWPSPPTQAVVTYDDQAHMEWVETKMTALQQAAEQACYRYALAVLERCMTKLPEDHAVVNVRKFHEQVAAVRQLIAGSA